MSVSFTPNDTIGGETAPGAYRKPEGASPDQSVEPLALPPNVDASKFQEYANRAGNIVGPDNVTIISDRKEFGRYDYFNPSKAADMFNLMDSDYFVCSAVIAPRGVEDTQALMKLANEYEIPQWPFSVGRNLGYGAAAPRVRGSVCLDMGRHMKKILKVDVEGAYALVEPGVTFFDLHNYLVCSVLR